MEDAAKVLFPSVHDVDAGELISLQCFPDDNLRGMVKVTSGIDDEQARNIIGAARYDENTSQSILVNVSNPQFSGRSYGLALALADKIVRHGKHPGLQRVIATGVIEPDGCGRVDAVGSFETKLRFLLRECRAGDLFVFPEANLHRGNTRQQTRLQQLKDKGVDNLAVSHVTGCAGRVWQLAGGELPVRSGQKRLSKPLWMSGVAALALVMIAAGAVIAHQWKKAEEINGVVERPQLEAQSPAFQVAAPKPAPPRIERNTVAKPPVQQQQPPAQQVTHSQQQKPLEANALQDQAAPDVAPEKQQNWFIHSVDVPTDAY